MGCTQLKSRKIFCLERCYFWFGCEEQAVNIVIVCASDIQATSISSDWTIRKAMNLNRCRRCCVDKSWDLYWVNNHKIWFKKFPWCARTDSSQTIFCIHKSWRIILVTVIIGYNNPSGSNKLEETDRMFVFVPFSLWKCLNETQRNHLLEPNEALVESDSEESNLTE